MKLLLLRHGLAVEPEDFLETGLDDSMRPLTNEGREKMTEGAKALSRLVSDLELIFSSPYRRTLETAEILSQAYGGKKVVPAPALASGATPEKVLAAVLKNPIADVIALVGHAPDMSLLACYLLTGKSTPFLRFKKGGACLIEFAGKIVPGQGMLEWALNPAQLRKL